VIAKEVAQNQVQNQINVNIVVVMVKLDLTKVSLQFNKRVLNVMGMEKQLVRHAKNVKVMGRFKAMKMFQ